MLFTELQLKGAYLIQIEEKSDDRGFFARSWCQNEFKRQGLNPKLVQCNISFNKFEGTLRGMHYQVAPYEEAKLVRCTMGAIYDVIIDLRPKSITFKKWIAVELTAENRYTLYVSEGFSHGFQTLSDNTEVFYQMSEFYHPECARGIRWNDSMIGIKWPIENPILSERDKSYKDFMVSV